MKAIILRVTVSHKKRLQIKSATGIYKGTSEELHALGAVCPGINGDNTHRYANQDSHPSLQSFIGALFPSDV